MNETIQVEAREFEEKTVDKAIEEACRHFGCTKDDLDVEIITRGSTGLFGLGGKKARIKAKPKPGLVSEVEEEASAKESASPSPETSEVSSEPESEVVPSTKEAASEERQEASQTTSSRQSELSREDIERHVELACKITNEILSKSGLSGKANVVEQAAKPYVNVSGDDLALIIGKDGQTLDALEYLVNLCLRRQNPDVNFKVMLEAAGYRERRKRNLISLAERLAIKVKRTGRALSLSPMPARERRIVHVALKEFKGIKTHSSGQGSNRKVVITPARRKRGPRKSKG